MCVCFTSMQADTVAVKQIDDEKCRLFAYELASLPGPAHPPPPPHTTTSHPSPSSSTSSKTPVTNSSSSERERKDTHDSSISGRKHSKGSDSETEGLPTKMFKSELQSPTRKVGNFSSAPVVDPPNDTPDSDKTAGIGGGGEKEDVPVVSQASAAAVVVEWHSCAICLEEMVDSDLVTHASCGAVLCPTCLQSSVDHYQKEDGLVPCPVSTIFKLLPLLFLSLTHSLTHSLYLSLLSPLTHSHSLILPISLTVCVCIFPYRCVLIRVLNHVYTSPSSSCSRSVWLLSSHLKHSLLSPSHPPRPTSES